MRIIRQDLIDFISRFKTLVSCFEKKKTKQKTKYVLWFLSSFNINLLAFYHECPSLIGYTTLSIL